MLTLFKRKKSVKQVIEAIHNEFDSAGDLLLKEAKEVISKEIVSDKGDRLKSLGFTSSVHVVESAALGKEKKEKEELSRLIEYYRVYYTNNKFITEKMVDAICKKYNLLHGSAERYKGDVPLKNLFEIEAFRLREEDMEKVTYGYYDNGLTGRFFHSSPNGPFYGYPVRGSWGESFISMDREGPTHHFDKPTFTICAPEKEFDTRGMSKKGHTLIPDPIVLQPVRGGYLIVSKWGLEASDELAVDQAKN